jgi:hypothetical protein
MQIQCSVRELDARADTLRNDAEGRCRQCNSTISNAKFMQRQPIRASDSADSTIPPKKKKKHCRRLNEENSKQMRTPFEMVRQ